ncbi:MAG TPA: kelch repeat-containing protein [Archangium sp.]|jgi:hypothetical protein|uniref:kelch repeat-containing protein n=1 Tax=Archangium sp. TaxID=1872627 RepID=UPI002ED9BA90
MSALRSYHTALLLPSGKVLVFGGYAASTYQSSAAFYDPASNTWSATATPSAARVNHTATLLPNGKGGIREAEEGRWPRCRFTARAG